AQQPRSALAELTAVLAALARPDPVWRARRAAAGTRALPRRSLTPLLAGRRDGVRQHRDRWHRHRMARRAGMLPRQRPAPGGGGWKAPALLATVLAAVSVTALHRLVGPGPVAGGALAPAPGSLGDLWASARSTWNTAGLGSAGSA